MAYDTWNAVDRFIGTRLVGHDDALQAALDDATAAGLPPIAVSPPQGKLLHVLARSIGARTALEIGTLGGYSAIWLARALGPGGRLVTLEFEPRHAEVARANLTRAGVADVVEIRVGRGLDLLPVLAEELGGPVLDFVFVDADKRSNPDYFRWAVRLTRPGGMIVVDNVVRDGAVVDEQSEDPDIVGTRRLFDEVAAEPRVEATAVQTVGSKGYDGFLVALVLPDAA